MGGDAIEYLGFTISMGGNPYGPAVSAGGAVLDYIGTGIIIVDELIESKGSKVSTDTKVEIGFHIIDGVVDASLPKPFEKVKDLPKNVKEVFKGHAEAAKKATSDVVKEEVKKALTEDKNNEQ